MKLEITTPDNTILQELGRRLARTRKQQGHTQVQLAAKAGIGVATLRRIEAGQDSQMESWLKLLKALNRLSTLDAVLPEQSRSPRAEVQSTRKRRPAREPRTGWGDEQA